MKSNFAIESQTHGAPGPQPVYVLAGQVRVSSEPTRYSTVLGSCVAVCLYDIRLQIGGINHIQMPGNANKNDKEPLRWAGPATHHLIAALLDLGATPESLQAKVFGGANINARNVPPELRIGDRNVLSVLSLLRESAIRIVSSSAGGSVGRKIIFDTRTGDVWVKLLGLDPDRLVETKTALKRRGTYHVE